jgi:hypothetical protein
MGETNGTSNIFMYLYAAIFIDLLAGRKFNVEIFRFRDAGPKYVETLNETIDVAKIAFDANGPFWRL